MDNRMQSNLDIPLTSSPVEARASNMYFLQVKQSNSEQAEAIPLHMLINEQDGENEQYLISVLQAKQLQLFIEPRGQLNTNPNSQYYELPVQESLINSDFTSADTDIQILNSLNNFMTHQPKTEDTSEIIPEIPSDAAPSSSNLGLKSINVKESLTSRNQRKVVQKFVHIADRVVPPRAVAVLPSMLQLRREVVSPRRPLPARVRFGPVIGVNQTLSPGEAETLIAELTSSQLPVFLLKTDNDSVIHIDVSDMDKSNWLSLLPLGDQTSANVWLSQEGAELFAVTTQPLAARTPLVLGYSREYVDAHRLPVQQPVLDLDAELVSKYRQWWCGECQRALPSAALLQRHIDVHHLEEKQRSQQRYRCRHCTRTFCRLFTLRRHIARHCTKNDREEKQSKPAEPVNGLIESSKPEELPDLSLNITNADDSRLPSDESLQTLTNNLDFSTNLFDTDRMPNLDMSGSSRSEDFNPYSLGLKDDVALANTIEFPLETETNTQKEVKTDSVKTMFLTCRYCNQTVVRGRQRQHVRMCTGRKFQCECGRTFLYKDKLALHIHIEHANGDLSAKKDKQETKESNSLQYKCETCKHTFKRRGMLVNHMWRVHKNVNTAIPLEKKVRHYPCVACPKVYGTAAKRERHVRAHHPGHEVKGAPAIEGGVCRCVPAACTLCPRQYATRAKLLQHARAKHPQLAPPVKKRPSLKGIEKNVK